MSAVRFTSRALTFAAPVAAAVLFAGVATAAPTQPLGTAVAWLNPDNGRTGIVDLTGEYPNLSAMVDTGPGQVLTTVFGSVSLASGPLCNSTPATGGVTVG